MINVYFILEKLLTKSENEQLVETYSELEDAINNYRDKIEEDIRYECDIFSLYVPKDNNEKNELSKRIREIDDIQFYVINLNGKILKISDYDKMMGNIDLIKRLGTEEISKDIDGYRDEALRLTHLDPEENLIDCIRGSVILNTVYNILDNILDENKKRLENAIVDELIEQRKEEENARGITNELEMVDSVIDKYFPGKKEEVEILSCEYNGEPIDQGDLVDKLASHVFPQYLTQIDIRTTLEDTYIIKTNMGNIVREKGTGRIYAIKSENEND